MQKLLICVHKFKFVIFEKYSLDFKPPKISLFNFIVFVIDHDTNRSWATNLIKIEVIDPKVNNLVNNKSFWVPLLLFSICFVIFNLVVLSKNFIIKNKTKFKN